MPGARHTVESFLCWRGCRCDHTKDLPCTGQSLCECHTCATQLALHTLLLLQVGQLTCEGLAHAYTQCAAVNITSAPLLAALRKATRVKLNSFQPADLTAVLTALAALGQQDLLYLDEIAR